jgi:hypothetical protein
MTKRTNWALIPSLLVLLVSFAIVGCGPSQTTGKTTPESRQTACNAATPCPYQSCMCSGSKVTGPRLACKDNVCTPSGMQSCQELCDSADINERPGTAPPRNKRKP